MGGHLRSTKLSSTYNFLILNFRVLSRKWVGFFFPMILAIFNGIFTSMFLSFNRLKFFGAKT